MDIIIIEEIITFEFSYHNKAWLRDKTLQSNIALLTSGFILATERPILHGLSK